MLEFLHVLGHVLFGYVYVCAANYFAGKCGMAQTAESDIKDILFAFTMYPLLFPLIFCLAQSSA